MKRVRTVQEPTAGLADYLDSVDRGSWDDFGSHIGGRSLRELREVLVGNQHGLCAYCEKAVAAERAGSQIEHVVPRSDPMHGPAKELDITNLVACCDGGEKETTGSGRRGRRTRLSCGQAKGDRSDPDFVDPRALPASPALVSVDSSGRIEADRDACRSAGWSPERVSGTVEVLNLNTERLCLARERWWGDLVATSTRFDDPTRIGAWVQEVLTPDEDERLVPFFSTSRSYFGRLGERVLVEPPQDWI